MYSCNKYMALVFLFPVLLMFFVNCRISRNLLRITGSKKIDQTDSFWPTYSARHMELAKERLTSRYIYERAFFFISGLFLWAGFFLSAGSFVSGLFYERAFLWAGFFLWAGSFYERAFFYNIVLPLAILLHINI